MTRRPFVLIAVVFVAAALIAGLAGPGFLVEIEVIAARP